MTILNGNGALFANILCAIPILIRSFEWKQLLIETKRNCLCIFVYIYSCTFRHSANTHFLFPVITEWLHDWIQSPWGGGGDGEVESLTWATNTWPWSSGRCALWAPLGWRTSRRPHPVKHKRPVIMTRTQHHGNICSVFRNNVYTDIKREDEQRLCGGARDGGKTKMMFDKIKQKSQMDHQRDVSAFELQRLTVLHKSVECYSSSPTHTTLLSFSTFFGT